MDTNTVSDQVGSFAGMVRGKAQEQGIDVPEAFDTIVAVIERSDIGKSHATSADDISWFTFYGIFFQAARSLRIPTSAHELDLLQIEHLQAALGEHPAPDKLPELANSARA